MKNTEKTMDKIVALCKNRGFVFPGSEIYGALPTPGTTAPSRRAQEEHQERLVEEVRAGESLQRRP